MAECGRHKTRQALEQALARRVEFMLADARGVVAGSVRPVGEQWPELAAFAEPVDALWAQPRLSCLQRAAVALSTMPQSSYAARGLALADAIARQESDAVWSALFTDKGTPRQFGRGARHVQPPAVQAAQDMLTALQPARQQHAGWQHQQRMMRLTRALLAEYAALKRDNGWVDMADVERGAVALLSDPVASGWVQERLDQRVRHLLIDEFQDTNPLQWQALQAWLAAYTGAGERPGVFIVGDPKQSIYRFRRAEPQVFRAAQRFITEGLGGHLLACDHTRRSAQAVLATVNAVLAELSARRGWDDLRPHTSAEQATGAVLRLPRVERPPAAPRSGGIDVPAWRPSLTQPRVEAEETVAMRECQQAARWLAARLARGDLGAGDVMVLARKRDRLVLMDEALRALHLPTCQPERSRLADMPEVADLVALLDALVSPRHDLSLARALKSPLFGLQDDALTALALRQRRQPDRCWFDLLQESQQPDGIPQGLGATLATWAGWVASLPPHDALARVWHAGDVPARFVASAAPPRREAVRANLQALLHAALDLAGGRLLTPYALVRALRAGASRLKAPAREWPDAIRLLTVHGAKGLEAPLVLWLDTDAAEARADPMPVLLDWPGESPAPRRFVFLQDERSPPSCCTEVAAADHAARAREEANGLYVALTRARSELVLSAHEPRSPSADSPWNRLSPHVRPWEPDADDTHTLGVAASAPDPVIWDLPSTGSAQSRVGVSPAPSGDSSPDARAALVGEAMHRLLQWGWTSAGWTATQLRAVRREFRLDDDAVERAADMARRIATGAGAWAWDAARLDWQGNEVPLTRAGQVLRADRVVRLRDGTWWVFDHKSAAAPQAQPLLREQLLHYREALRAGLPADAVVRCAFLTGDGALIEITPTDASPRVG